MSNAAVVVGGTKLYGTLDLNVLYFMNHLHIRIFHVYFTAIEFGPLSHKSSQ